MQVRKIPEFCGFQGLLWTSWDSIGGGDGGIRTLDTRYGYGSLAGNWFQPLTHVSAYANQADFDLRSARYNSAYPHPQGREFMKMPAISK